MGRRGELRAQVAALDTEEVPSFLDRNSGLPGPRGNLELLEAFADVAPAPLVWRLAHDEDEYRRCAGVVGLGRIVDDVAAGPATKGPGGGANSENTNDDAPAALALLRTRAADASWRVREAVAMALQRIGDGHPEALRAVVADWSAAREPLVLRAAVAGVCEPRLLADPATATAALDACAAATSWLRAVPSTGRRDPEVRTLRQGLGYCWSVAVAGDPAHGLPAFAALEAGVGGDADIAWIVRENRRKARLVRLLPG